MRTTTRTTLLLGLVALGLLTILAVVVLRPGGDLSASPSASASQASEARTAHRDAARAELASGVGDFRRALWLPVTDARSAVSGLRPLIAEAVIGGERDADALRDAIDERVERVLERADDLEAAAGEQTTPSRPNGLASADVDPVFARLATLEEHAPEVADKLRDAATDGAAVADAALELRERAGAYAASADDLPDSSEVDDLLAAWESERERLNDYHGAANTASDHPELAEHARAHRALIAELAELADASIADLEDEDVDAYNDRLAARTDASDDLVADIDATLQEALDAAVGEVESAEDRALGFIAELDRVRAEATPSTTDA